MRIAALPRRYLSLTFRHAPVAMALLLAPALGAQEVPVIPFTETELVTDGVLDEAAWETAWRSTEFRQVRPATGEPATQLTEVRLMRDAGHLHFAIIAQEEDPLRVVATQMKRDADLLADDHVTLVLDTFRDRRNGYLFRFNALGAREDALIENVKLINKDWDGLWRVRARRTATGWIAEGAIPWTTLNFNPTNREWAFNVERFMAGRQETVRWRNPSRVSEVYFLPGAEPLMDFSGLRQGLGIDWKPFVTATAVQDKTDPDQPVDTRLKSGFDLFYRPTPAITTVLTYNTDFAETEVDDRQVNLTRFPLFFPEKRAFFLQDAGLFSFGGINRSPLPYYSRRIGLDGRGQTVDLLGGAKISGRQGPVNFGLFNAWMEETPSVPSKRLGVARVEVNVLEESSIGGIATWGDPVRAGENRLGGLDFKYRASDLSNDGVLEAYLWYQNTRTSGLSSESDAFGWESEYHSNTWGYYHFWEYIEPDYYPGLGRVSQTDIWQGNFRLEREFRREGWKKILPQAELFMRWSLEREERELLRRGLGVLSETASGDKIEAFVRYEDERLPRPFTIDGHVIRPGDFEGPGFEVAWRGSRSRVWAVEGEYEYKHYYGGTLRTYIGILAWRPGARFNLNLSYTQNRVRLPYDRFLIHLVKADATVNLSPDLILSFLVQWDNTSDSLGTNTRLRWTFRPGSDFFVVFNQGYDTELEAWQRLEANVKAGFTFQF